MYSSLCLCKVTWRRDNDLEYSVDISFDYYRVITNNLTFLYFTKCRVNMAAH